MGSVDYAALLDGMRDLVFVFDSEGSLREWNESVIERTGRTAAALSGASITECFTARDSERVTRAVERTLSDGSATVEAELVTATGKAGPYAFEFDRVDGFEEGAGAVVAVGRDVENHGQAARGRHELLDRMSDGFHVLDRDWRITDINEPGAAIVAEAMGRDLGPEELVGMNLWEEIPAAVDTTFYERYHEAMETQEQVSFQEYYEPLDTWFEVRAYPSETDLAVYFHDVTERREQRESLARRERVLRQMYDVIADRDRSFTEQVEALLDLGRSELGTAYGSLAEIRGDEYVFEVVSTDDDIVQAGDVVPLSATNCEITASREETIVLGDIARDAPEATDRAGYTDWGIACYIGAPVYVDDEVYGTFCFYDTEPRANQFTDWERTLVDLMSRWVSYERQRQRTTDRLERQNERLDRFASVLSHDLRNPLNVLEMRLEMAAEHGDTEHFEHCFRALDRMSVLVEDLLMLARGGDAIGEMVAVSLETVAARCWETVATDAATLRVETDRRIRADESRLRQLLENLYRNAVEHGGDDVTVRVGALPDGFYVADDGPGIDADDRASVFETGYTTTEHGSGIGLSIVFEIADAHDWHVTVGESEDGGARFEFTGVTEVDQVEA